MIICLDYTYIYSNIVYSSDISYYTGYSTSNTTPYYTCTTITTEPIYTTFRTIYDIDNYQVTEVIHNNNLYLLISYYFIIYIRSPTLPTISFTYHSFPHTQ